jgi:succinate dehydrogenase / fumarate reductase flavoprotein subunit
MGSSLPGYEEISTDVLIIGAGGAGLRAAISAAEQGLKVAVICKSLLGKAHTVMAEGGIASSLGNVDPDDSWETHFKDTMRGGQMLNNWRMAELLARESPERVMELERWGMVFDRTPDGKILQRPFGAHTYRRLCHVGDRTGLVLIRTLQDKAVSLDVDAYMEYTVIQLLTDSNGRVVGALSYRRASGEFVVFRAKATIVATGGWGKMYSVTSNSWEGTGDGAVLAYDVGAELMDIEMVQFHPTGMVWPPGVRGILVTEAVRGEGGILVNSEDERFMERYDPQKMELSSRDVVARAIYQEVEAGRGSPHGGVYLDVSHRGASHIRKRLPSMYHQFKTLADIDITAGKFEVGPTIHYAMGGIRVDPESQVTTLEGLYATGEVACGVHGANRLGGNALADLLVFGKRAGDAAGEFANSISELGPVDDGQVNSAIESILAPFSRDGDENPFELHAELQATMQEHVSLARTEEGLNEALAKVHELKERAERTVATGTPAYNPRWHGCREVPVMLTICESMIRCAIDRRESRGAQWRLDYRDPDPALGKVNFVTKKEDGGMQLATAPVPEMPARLAELFD